MTVPQSLRGIAAVHVVAAECARRGYVPLPTIRNTEGFDAALINPTNKKNLNVQVKVNSEGTNYWFVSKKPLEYFHVLVEMPDEGNSELYFVPGPIIDKKKRTDVSRAGKKSDYRYVTGRWDVLENAFA
jgi:hypothetical protein